MSFRPGSNCCESAAAAGNRGFRNDRSAGRLPGEFLHGNSKLKSDGWPHAEQVGALDCLRFRRRHSNMAGQVRDTVPAGSLSGRTLPTSADSGGAVRSRFGFGQAFDQLGNVGCPLKSNAFAVGQRLAPGPCTATS